MEPLEAVGLPVSKMNKAQKKLLLQLVREYVMRHRVELARVDLARIAKAGEENILFAWAGSLVAGEGHYYRVQGPTFLFEYANTQNDANPASGIAQSTTATRDTRTCRPGVMSPLPCRYRSGR